MASKWIIDFTSLEQSRPKGSSFTDPPGYTIISSKKTKAIANTSTRVSQHEQELLKVKKAWDAALATAKNIPMNAIMLWMSGNGVQIFSVMITAMLFITPVKALMAMNQTFEKYDTPHNKMQMMFPKIAFIGLQLITMALGLYKCSAMGLLPTTSSDWLAFMSPREIMEKAVVGHSL